MQSALYQDIKKTGHELVGFCKRHKSTFVVWGIPLVAGISAAAGFEKDSYLQIPTILGALSFSAFMSYELTQPNAKTAIVIADALPKALLASIAFLAASVDVKATADPWFISVQVGEEMNKACIERTDSRIFFSRIANKNYVLFPRDAEGLCRISFSYRDWTNTLQQKTEPFLPDPTRLNLPPELTY